MENTLYRRVCGQKSGRILSRNLLLFGFPLIFCFAWIYPYLPWHNLGLCAVKRMIGINCPGCGFVRSVFALLNGDVRQSILLNPMGSVAAFIVSCLWLKELFKYKFQLSPKVVNFVALAFVAGLFVQWFAYLIINFV